MSDGGQISIDWLYPQHQPDNNLEHYKIKKVCMIFPGLSGGSEKGYVKVLSHYLAQELGYVVAVFHNRGVGNTEYTSPEFADLSRSEELEKAIDHMVSKFKNSEHECYFVGVGMSMGANLLLKIAGE